MHSVRNKGRILDVYMPSLKNNKGYRTEDHIMQKLTRNFYIFMIYILYLFRFKIISISVY